MDGLECTELFLSSVLSFSDSFRIDSHFFEKEYRELKKKMDSLDCQKIKDIVLKPVQTGHTPSMEVLSYYGGEIAFIKTDNLHDNQISMSFSDYLTETGNEKIKSTSLAEKDIITTIIGATEKIIARSAMIFSEHLPANINQNIVQIRVDDKKMYPEYVNIYLNCLYGKNYLLYLSRQTEQVNLNCKEVEIVPVPIFSTEFQSKIADIVNKARSFQYESESEYQRAEKLLITKLGFDGFKEPCEVCTVTNITSSFLKSGRLDAEYYQLRYDMLFDILKKLNTRRLSEIVSIKKSIEPGSEYYGDVGVPFVRVSDLSKFEVSEPDIKIPKSLCVTDSSLFPEKDTILFSKDGSIGIAYKVEKDEEFVTSGALLHLKVKNTDEILPDYLTLVLNSKIVQMQAERDAGGSVIKHWKPDEIKNVVIPVLDIELQKQISKQAQHCFKMRKAAKELLNKAILIVETAIENGEEEAMKLF